MKQQQQQHKLDHTRTHTHTHTHTVYGAQTTFGIRMFFFGFCLEHTLYLSVFAHTHTTHTHTHTTLSAGWWYLPIGYSQSRAAIHQLAATNAARLAQLHFVVVPLMAGAQQPLPLQRPQRQQPPSQSCCWLPSVAAVSKQRCLRYCRCQCRRRRRCCRRRRYRCQDLLYCGDHRAVWCCVPDVAVRLYNSRHLILFCISICLYLLIFR